MSRKILLLLPVLIAIAGEACKRDAGSVVYSGKLIVKDGCGTYVVQVMNNPAPPNMNSSWKYTGNDSVYNNVFSASNFAELQKSGLQQGDSLSFTIGVPSSDEPVYNTCAVMFSTPSAINYLQHIKKIN